MEELIQRFENIIDPDLFFKNWTAEEFKKWVIQGDNIELKNMLTICECHEMYVYCTIIRDILSERFTPS